MDPLLIHARHGNLYAYPTDHYLGQAIVLFGEYSELEYQFLHDALEPTGTEGTIVEVGANAGYLSCALYEHCTTLACYEPQQAVYELLNRNLLVGISGRGSVSNDGETTIVSPITIHKVIVEKLAVGSVAGEIDCPVIPYSQPGNHGCLRMGKQQREGVKPREYVKVPVVRLDDQGHTHVKLIKVDVEGMELQVLKGARQLILRDLPILYVENDQPDKSQELIEYVWGLGYWCAWHTPHLFNPDNFFRKPARENPWGAAQSINMVCLPKDRRLPAGVPTKHKLRLIDDATKHPTKDEV